MLKLSLDLKHDMWTYFVLYLVKRKYWNDPCRENEVFAYMVTCSIDMKVDLVPRCPLMRYDIWIYLVLNLVNIKYWDDPCRKKEILASMIANLRNGKVELVLWFKTWYVNVFCFEFGKLKVLECSLSRKREFSLYGNIL